LAIEHDPDRVTRLVAEIREARDVLDELDGEPREQFLSDRHHVGSAKYALVVAIEGCLDLASHWISSNDLRVPESYAETFEILADNAVVDQGFADRLGRMARFRNRLIPIDWEIDDEQIHSFLQSDIEDIDRFVDHVLDAIQD